ncbi:MAG: chromate transporter [Erysipelotrichaceae bacterium]|nr:chromate transporter [Erysipelotrichaceae bacterium]
MKKHLSKRKGYDMVLIDLFLGFLKVGLFAFGGSYGSIPLIRDIVLSYGWLSDETFTYLVAIAESTPGPIMINLATYTGNVQAGVIGAIIASLAVVLPSFCIVLLIMVLMKNALKNNYVKAILKGLKPAIIGIILATGSYMIINNCLDIGAINYRAIFITVLLIIISLLSRYKTNKKLSPIRLIIISSILGIIVYGINF